MDIKGFLEELTILSKKYEAYIRGCGCCDSPDLVNMNNHTKYDEQFNPKEKVILGHYEVDEYNGNLRWEWKKS